MSKSEKIIYGTDPFLVFFKDQSKGRSYPVGYWTYDFGDSIYYGNSGIPAVDFNLPSDYSVLSDGVNMCQDVLNSGRNIILNPSDANVETTHITGISFKSGTVVSAASDVLSSRYENGYKRYLRTQGSPSENSFTSVMGISSNPDSCEIESCYPEDDRGNLVAHIYKGPGVYVVEQSVSAASSKTPGWKLSETNFTGNGEGSDFYTVVVAPVCPCVNIKVYPGDPSAGSFRAITITSEDYSADFPEKFNTVSGYASRFSGDVMSGISGYAPFLKVYTSGTISPRSLPITGAAWNWSDWYSDYVESDIFSFGEAKTGWPVWKTTKHWAANTSVGPCITASGVHVYTIPGIYGVALHPYVDYDSTRYVASSFESECEDLEYILSTPAASTNCLLLKEITMRGGEISSAGMSQPFPTTISGFRVDGLTAGSYPIGKMDWDFGDGSPIVSVSRYTTANYDSDEWVNSYPNESDERDPRNFTPSHVYRRTAVGDHPDGYTVSVTAYACNTHSSKIITAAIPPASLPLFSETEGDLRLLDNRVFGVNDETMLTFEGVSSKQIYIMKQGKGDE